MNDSRTPAKRLTADEITGLIHELARDGDGADRRWALRQLSVGDASITLPAPKTDEEVLDRLARLNRGVGCEMAKKGFMRAFPASTPPGWSLGKKAGHSVVPTTLKELYLMCPDAPKDPFLNAPPGYPEKGILLKKRRFLADLYIELMAAKGQKVEAPEEVEAAE